MLQVKDQPRGPGHRVEDERAIQRARLARHILRHLPETGDHQSAVPGLSFHRRDGHCEPMSALYEPSLTLVVQGRKRVVQGAQTHEYDAGRFMLTSVDLPTLAQVLGSHDARPFLSVMLRLDLTVVQAIGSEIDLQDIPTRGAGPGTMTGMATGMVTAEMLDAIARLAALADAPRDIPVMGNLVLREIVYHLLMGPAGAQLRQIAMRGSRAHRIAGVIAWLREHHAEPVRIETLADMAAMGVSTLHHHFAAITRLSPLQYQKQIRLHEARRLLLTEPVDAGTAAFRVGYESVTQFSREYRRLFGNPPMRDMAVIRGR